MSLYDEARAAIDAAEAEAAALAAQASAEIEALRAETARLEADLEECRASHPPEEPAVKFGAAWKNGESLPSVVTSLDFFRYFFQPKDFQGGKQHTFMGEEKLRRAYEEYGCRIFSISFKPDSGNAISATALTNIRKFLESAPDDAEVLVTFYHEHDGNIADGTLSVAQYTAGAKAVQGVAAALGMPYGPIHNAMVRQNKTSGPWGLWPQVWASNEASGVPLDFWGVDCYSPEYQAPSPRMDPIKTYADGLSLPVLVGEMASPYDDAARQASWATAAREWVLKNARWASWWSSQVDQPGKENWRLRDQSAINWFDLT